MVSSRILQTVFQETFIRGWEISVMIKGTSLKVLHATVSFANHSFHRHSNGDTNLCIPSAFLKHCPIISGAEHILLCLLTSCSTCLYALQHLYSTFLNERKTWGGKIIILYILIFTILNRTQEEKILCWMAASNIWILSALHSPTCPVLICLFF
jgi:hypothetical protein